LCLVRELTGQSEDDAVETNDVVYELYRELGRVLDHPYRPCPSCR
jgi:hypothetical protein